MLGECISRENSALLHDLQCETVCACHVPWLRRVLQKLPGKLSMCACTARRGESRSIMVQVEAWQKIQREAAKNDGYVCTILGRRRLLPDAKGGGRKAAQVSNPPSLPALAALPLPVLGTQARCLALVCAPPALAAALGPCCESCWHASNLGGLPWNGCCVACIPCGALCG